MKAMTFESARRILIGLAVVCLLIGMAAPGCSKQSSYSITDDFGDITWPNSPVAQMLPEPESKFGKISSDSADYLSVYIGKTSKGQYESYVAACQEKGFTVDYSRTDDTYTALNESGYKLHIYYRDDEECMDITASKPEPEDAEAEAADEQAKAEAAAAAEKAEQEEAAKQEAEKKAAEEKKAKEAEEKKAKSSGNGIDPEFKEAVDSYEDFFEEYCKFMKKYSTSDNTASMMTDYAKFVAQYTDTMNKMDALGEEDLNSKEEEYYLKAQNRINKMLADTAAEM